MYQFLFRFRYPFTLLFIVLILLLVLFQSRKDEGSNRWQKVIQTVSYPIQSGVHNLVNTFNDWWEGYVMLIGIRNENQQLLQEIAELKDRLNRSLEDSVQYNRLRGQLLFAQRQPDRKVFAEIIGESIDNIHQMRLINRGSKHGLKRNFSAILREGLVGRVQSVTPFQSNLQLITDFRSRVPALIQRNRIRGLIYGTQTGLEMRQINRRAKVKKGDRVITSGLGGLYPKGILIGTIVEVRVQPHELFQTASIETAVDLSRMEEVFIIISGSYPEGSPIFTD
ncbi:MAG: rod shape-determining protein MreC [Proteobacteria bacterium]|nr:rod shape-determining protein MreC [Pseudomonadota bacterium]MBI13052.1 rod shape-determining protein MreC [Deltaproteobacteria bacterium]MBP45843.1 rod shape-determining protein MreC [Deltaproteobacteria bacterium]HCP33676.1 rod shape-determining protein MreC [Deltaproteobacteria bacterium]